MATSVATVVAVALAARGAAVAVPVVPPGAVVVPRLLKCLEEGKHVA